MIASYSQRLKTRSAALLLALEGRLDRIMIGWLVLAGLAAWARVATSPVPDGVTPAGVLPYMLVVLAPIGSMALALRWFARGDRMPQPQFRLARIGRWRKLSAAQARGHALYGASGIMVSLLVGMLLNVPVRAAEYLASMPAIPDDAPQWLSTLHLMMSLDVVLLTSLYAIAFVAALRRVPLFPRLLLAIWMVDLAMQLAIADAVAGADGLPPAVGTALRTVLDGNVKKVLISAALWLPYLLMSERVNVTFRQRRSA